MTSPKGFTTVIPYIFANNADDYVVFLKRAFGAMEIGRSVKPNGGVANCQIRIGDAVLMVSDASSSFPPAKSAFYLYVADADRAMKTAIDAGGEVVMEVADMPYGDRQGGVMDTSGNIWWISQRLVDGAYF